MIHLPFINKYPYTSMEAVNIDWLLNQVSKIPVLEDMVNQHETRINTLEETAADHEQRLTAAEGDIDALEGRMDTAEGDISDLKERMQTAEGDIDSLEGRMDTAEGDIDDLEAAVGDSSSGLVKDVADIKQNIIDINTKDQAQDNDIQALDQRVTTLEGESAVIANPGGTGANLNTISIDDVTYVIPSGGGGGGGSTVTPNPAGTPTATLNTVDIDGTIFDMPVDASDIAQINSDVSAIDTRVETLENSVGNVGSRTVSSSYGDLTNTSQVQDLADTEFTIPEGKQVIVIAHCDIDTTNFGSTPRYLGFYLRELETGTTYSNNCLTKFCIRGDEPSMITSAANMALTQRLGPGTYKFAVRCYSNTTKSFHYNIYADIITIRENPYV